MKIVSKFTIDFLSMNRQSLNQYNFFTGKSPWAFVDMFDDIVRTVELYTVMHFETLIEEMALNMISHNHVRCTLVLKILQNLVVARLGMII